MMSITSSGSLKKTFTFNIVSMHDDKKTVWKRGPLYHYDWLVKREAEYWLDQIHRPSRQVEHTIEFC
jgi:hypothetical protein